MVGSPHAFHFDICAGLRRDRDGGMPGNADTDRRGPAVCPGPQRRRTIRAGVKLAMEKVATAERDEFAAHHRTAWGSQIRIADIELVGTRRKSADEIRVLLHVSWYRPEENELKQTTIEQIWSNTNGWLLSQEKLADGDIGLLGEPVDRAPRPRRRAHLLASRRCVSEEPPPSEPHLRAFR